MFPNLSGAKRYVPLVILVLLALPLAAYAQVQGSKHFPNDKQCVNPNDCNVPNTPAFRPLGVNIAYTNTGVTHYFTLSTVCSDGTGNPINTIQTCPLLGDPTCTAAGGNCINQLRENATFTGQNVAARLAKAICYQAVGRSTIYDVRDSANAPMTTAAQCNALGDGPFSFSVRDTTWNRNCGFMVIKGAAAETGLTFAPAGAQGGQCQFEAVHTTNNGTTTQDDMLNHVLLQVDANTQTTGNWNFKLWSTGNVTPTADCTFSLPIATATHAAIATAIQNCTTPPGLVALSRTLKDDSDFSGPKGKNPTLYLGYQPDGDTPGADAWTSGDYVIIVNAGAKLQQVEIGTDNTATSSMPIIRMEVTNKNKPGIPALNPWGVAILVAVLLLSSLWFFRRQAKAREV